MGQLTALIDHLTILLEYLTILLVNSLFWVGLGPLLATPCSFSGYNRSLTWFILNNALMLLISLLKGVSAKPI